MSQMMWYEFLTATWETAYMVILSGLMAVLFGLPLGILLFTTRPHGLLAHSWCYRCLSALTNAIRSIPFIILLVAVIPLTRFITGTSIGTTAAIVPLTIGAIPFVGRLVETAMGEVGHGLVEAGLTMGATPFQIIYRILIPEALPALSKGITLMLVALIGYSAMAGAIGGGGLGDLAIRYGYQRFDVVVMIDTIIILIIMVQLLQYIGDSIAKKLDHR